MKHPQTETPAGLASLPREPDAPALSAAQIAEYTTTVFIDSLPVRSDLLFVFGVPHGNWNEVARLYHAGLAPRILAVGCGPLHPHPAGRPESHQIRESLLLQGVPADAIDVEDRSVNTLENVLFGKAAIERLGLPCASMLFFCHAHHSGRAWRTLARWFPTVHLSCASGEATYGSTTVRATDWWQHEIARRRVHGEYIRIQRYAERGDIVRHGPPASSARAEQAAQG